MPKLTVFILCLLTFGVANASANDMRRAPSDSRKVATVEISTVSITVHRDRQIAYCQQAIHLTAAQAQGRLLTNQRGLALNACTPLLENKQCREAFRKAGPRKASRRGAFRRITTKCAAAYCPNFLAKDKERLCGVRSKDDTQWATDFYATALRHHFLKINHIQGLRNSGHLARGFRSTY